MSKKTKASSKVRKATSKKVAPKSKVTAKKKVVKKNVTKPTKKVVAKKATPKKVTKPVKKLVVKKKAAKPVKKSTPKKATKVVKKLAVKKKVVKSTPKKAVKKVVAKKVVKKAAPKKAVKKIVAKKIIKKATPKKIAKPVKKLVTKPIVKKAPAKKTPTPAPKKAEVVTKKIEKKQITQALIQRVVQSVNPYQNIPAKVEKEPAGKFEMEFVVRASEDMVYEFVSTESGLSEWFCDDVTIRDGVYSFMWDGHTQQARLIKENPPYAIRYQWLDKTDGSYFEFKTIKDELTNDISLIITDFASDRAEELSAKSLWQSQVSKLFHVLGSVF